MVKVVAIFIPPSMTINARIPERDLMVDHVSGIQLRVTFPAGRGIEARNVAGVTVAAEERFIPSLKLVTV